MQLNTKPNIQAEFDNWVEINSKDGYSKATTDYAIAWADLMESELAKGKKLADIAKETSHTADTEGITGFMYGCAVGALAHFWVHGEELRRWSNKDIAGEEQGEKLNAKEGACANPALLTIGGSNE